MLSIPITGLGADFRLPGAYAELLFNQGAASAFAPGREVCFVMPMSAAGTWTANTRYPVPNEAVASSGAGAGSPLHRGLRKFLRHNPDAKVYAVPYSATSGGSPATATATIALSGTLTAGGTLTVIIAGEQIPVGYSSTQTMTNIG